MKTVAEILEIGGSSENVNINQLVDDATEKFYVHRRDTGERYFAYRITSPKDSKEQKKVAVSVAAELKKLGFKVQVYQNRDACCSPVKTIVQIKV